MESEIGVTQVTDGGDQTTRKRVTELILQQGPLTAADLAGQLNLTPAAIRRHLAALVDAGALGSREERIYGARGRGRPARVFFLTDQGRAEFYQAYDELAISALRHLAEAGGEDAVNRFATERIADVEKRYRELRASRPDASPVELLATALSEDGYVASIQPVHSGSQICQHHCPVAHVAQEFPQLCEIETQIFAKLLGSHVQRLATIAHGDGVCTTHVPAPRTEND